MDRAIQRKVVKLFIKKSYKQFRKIPNSTHVILEQAIIASGM
jgi:hypothetical protein